MFSFLLGNQTAVLDGGEAPVSVFVLLLNVVQVTFTFDVHRKAQHSEDLIPCSCVRSVSLDGYSFICAQDRPLVLCRCVKKKKL